MSTSPLKPRSAAARAISGQRLPVAPLSEAGFTRNAISVIGRDRGQRDARHAVDSRLEILVGDARELAADDDVADGEQASGLDAAERADREDDGGFHLDRQDPALRPPLVALRVWVVERVARGDGADAQ